MIKMVLKFKYAIFALLMIVCHGVEAVALTPWILDPGEYRYDMSLYIDVESPTGRGEYSRYELGAFVGEECRGIAEILVSDGKEICLYMRLRSNVSEGEEMTFQFYDTETDEILTVEDFTIPFVADSRIGYPSDPLIVPLFRYYEVRFIAQNGGVVTETGGRLREGTELTVSAIPHEGFHFIQWSDGPTDNPRTIIVDTDLTLTATFGPNIYHLIYMVDEEIVNDYEILYGMEITPDHDLEKEGYTFSGWSDIPETMPAHDITVTGSFTINSYHLSVYLNESLLYTDMLEYQTPVLIEEPVVPEGYVFDGWREEIPERMPSHDLEIHGTYSKIDSVKSIYTAHDRDITVYDMAGRRIEMDSMNKTVPSELPSGIYIINGEKYVK